MTWKNFYKRQLRCKLNGLPVCHFMGGIHFRKKNMFRAQFTPQYLWALQ